MRFPILLFVVLKTLKTIQCDATNIFNQIDSNKVKSDDNVSEHDEYVPQVYLEDVLYALTNQNWSPEEQPCLNQTVQLIQSLRNFTLWAVWNWDSIASQPLGILYGNRFQMGNFDECLNTPWTNTHPELKTQYCLSEIELQRTNQPVKRKKTYNEVSNPYKSAVDYLLYKGPYARPLQQLTWGVCVPASCSPRSVERLLSIMLARSHLSAAGITPDITVKDDFCQTSYEPIEFDGLFYSFVAYIGIIIAVCLICTYLNNQKGNKSGKTQDIIKAFCLRYNARKLLDYKNEGFEVLYGIRFLSICFIVMSHVLGLINAAPISNGSEVDTSIVRSAAAILVLHNDLLVDTFFYLSGFLLGMFFKKTKTLPNILWLLLGRYFRLVVAFSVVIFYTCAILQYSGSGPLWPRVVVQGEVEVCRKNWWISLLMLSNYVDSEKICIVPTWYIPVDFHYFLITAIIFYTFKNTKIRFLISFVLFMATLIATGIIQYLYNLEAVLLFTYDFLNNMRGNRFFQMLYIKSHTRFSSYFVGLACGYYFIHYKCTRNNKKISQKWSVLGTAAALAGMAIIMCFGVSFVWNEYHPAVGLLYGPLNRPLWCCCIALLTYCCSFGHVPLMKSFLSWYPWVPLSRLTYGIYLTHSLLITRDMFSTRNPRHYDNLQVLNTVAGSIFWSSITSLFLWLTVEGPTNNLLHMILKAKKKPATSDAENAQTTTTSTTTLARSMGNLHENYPPVITFSKM